MLYVMEGKNRTKSFIVHMVFLICIARTVYLEINLLVY